MTHSETPAVQRERERREKQDSLWGKVRSSARHLLNTKGKEGWIPTSEFTRLLAAEHAVTLSVIIPVLNELKAHGEAVYVLGEGYRHADSSFETVTDEPVHRTSDVKRRNDFLSFVQELKEIHGK